MEKDDALVVGAAGIECRGVSKTYSGTHALMGIDLVLEAGAIHALVGENGAGKSTCLGVMAGRVKPDYGSVRVAGRDLRLGDPRAARHCGVVAIYQELTVIPPLSAHANVFIGQDESRFGFLSDRKMRRRYEALCQRLGVEAVPPTVPAGKLSIADQQLLEIMRALVADARVILFDEPTAALALPERESLLRLMRELRQQGITVVFVSHNLDEVLAVADTITVFRDGRIELSARRDELTKKQMVEAMLGHAIGGRLAEQLSDGHESGPSGPRSPVKGTPLLKVEALNVPGAVAQVDLEVRGDEVLGIAGLVGSGRTSVLRAIAGLEPRANGRMWVDGRKVAWPRTVHAAQRLGIALLPEDRKTQGLVLGMTAMDNIALSDLGQVALHGLLSARRTASYCGPVAERFGFQPARLRDPAHQLSGGNQQKLLLARWAYRRPRILLADEPTRGVDIGAKEEIMAALQDMVADGVALVVVSSELEEVAAMSDRVLVLAEGRKVGALDGYSTALTQSRILQSIFEVEHHAAI